jgi:hypothetical protein
MGREGEGMETCMEGVREGVWYAPAAIFSLVSIVRMVGDVIIARGRTLLECQMLKSIKYKQGYGGNEEDII